jgi:outer membrane protein TolC
VIVTAFVVLGICGINSFGYSEQARAADPKNASDARADIAKEKIAVAKQALEIVKTLEKQGRIESGEVAIWSKRLVEATRKSGATKAEIVQAIKDHLARMDLLVEIMKQRQQSARGTALGVLNAQYDVLEAKAWLADEQDE